MAISADQVQIAVVAEDDYGVIPANPVFEVMPLTGESIVAEVSTTQSNMMTEDRQVIDSILTSAQASGSIETELAITEALYILMDSAMAESWVDIVPDVSGFPALVESMIGKEPLSYTIEKRFPDPAIPGSYLYHRIPGCVTNTFNLSVSPEEPATVSLGIIGKEMVTDTAEIAGATYIVPSNPIVLRGPDTVMLNIKGHSVNVNCFGEFSLDLNNNYRGVLCLGYLGNKEVAIGRAEITAAMQVYFSSNELLDTLLSQEETTLDFALSTNAAIDPGSYFAVHLLRVKFTQNSVVAGGSGEDVVNDIVVQALFNSAGTKDTLGTNDADKTSLRISAGAGALTP